MGRTLDLDTTYCLSNQVKFVVEAETLCSRTFFFYDFFTSTVPCDQIFALRPPIFLGYRPKTYQIDTIVR